jgi:hypothetical protein
MSEESSTIRSSAKAPSSPESKKAKISSSSRSDSNSRGIEAARIVPKNLRAEEKTRSSQDADNPVPVMDFRRGKVLMSDSECEDSPSILPLAMKKIDEAEGSIQEVIPERQLGIFSIILQVSTFVYRRRSVD